MDGSVESCVQPLRAYEKMFPKNLTTDGVSKPDAFHSENHLILESCTTKTLDSFFLKEHITRLVNSYQLESL